MKWEKMCIRDSRSGCAESPEHKGDIFPGRRKREEKSGGGKADRCRKMCIRDRSKDDSTMEELVEKARAYWGWRQES